MGMCKHVTQCAVTKKLIDLHPESHVKSSSKKAKKGLPMAILIFAAAVQTINPIKKGAQDL